MSMTIINIFEMVYINKKNRKGCSRLIIPINIIVQIDIQAPLVVQASYVINVN